MTERIFRKGKMSDDLRAAMDRAWAREFDGLYVGVDWYHSPASQVRCLACGWFEFGCEQLNAVLVDKGEQLVDLGGICRRCLALGPQGAAALMRELATRRRAIADALSSPAPADELERLCSSMSVSGIAERDNKEVAVLTELDWAARTEVASVPARVEELRRRASEADQLADRVAELDGDRWMSPDDPALLDCTDPFDGYSDDEINCDGDLSHEPAQCNEGDH